VFALFSIILIWKLIGEITQGRTGEEKRVIFLLCITTPFLWVLAGYARYYTLGMFLGLLSSYCYLLWVKEATPKNLFFTIIVTASLFYVHYLMAALVALGQGLHYLSGSKKRSARDVILWLTSQTIIIVLILPVLIWGIGPIISGSKDSLHNLAREGISGGKAIPMVLFGHIFTILTGAAPFPWDVWVTLPMTIATAGLVFHGIKGKGLLTSRESLCLAVIPLFLLTVMIPTLVPVTGYFMGVARAASLPMLVWISLGASYTTISSSFARKMVLSVMLLGNLYLITIYNLNVSSMTQTPPVKEIADYIRISSPEQSESTIVFSPFVHGWGEPLARYLPGYKVRSLTDGRRGISLESCLSISKRNYNHIWIIQANRFSENADKLSDYLKIQNYHLMGEKNFQKQAKFTLWFKEFLKSVDFLKFKKKPSHQYILTVKHYGKPS